MRIESNQSIHDLFTEAQQSWDCGKLKVQTLEENVIQPTYITHLTDGCLKAEKWEKLRQVISTIVYWKKAALVGSSHRNMDRVRSWLFLDLGSLSTYMVKSAFLSEECLPKPPPMHCPKCPDESQRSRVSPALVDPMSSKSPLRRRVHRLGDELSRRHNEGTRVAIRGAPSALHNNNAKPEVQRVAEDMRIILKPMPPQGTGLRPIPPNITTSSHKSCFTVGMAMGYSQPQERHPMLSSLALSEERRDVDECVPTHTQDPVLAYSTASLSHQLECRRLEDSRRCLEVEELLPQIKPRPPIEISCLRNKRRHKHRCLYNRRRPCSSRTTDDFMLVAQLLDTEQDRHVAPGAVVPLMFWFGLTKQFHTALQVFEIAFGHGNVASENLAQLANYCDVQVELVDSLRALIKRESFEELCDCIVHGDHIRTWFSSIQKNPDGNIDLAQLQMMLFRMGVISNSKVFARFLSHFGDDYMKQRTDQEGSSGDAGGLSLPSQSPTASGKKEFGFHFFIVMVCRSLVTWCFSHVLDLIKPKDSVEEACNVNMARRWAALHRRIVLSLVVNSHHWGKDGDHLLKTLGDQAAPANENDLDQERRLFQQVKAQGMACLLPEEDKIERSEIN